MIKKLLLLLIVLKMISLTSASDNGVIHKCRKVKDCVGLTPAANGCIINPEGGEPLCYWISSKKGNKVIDQTFNYHFDN
jgi:hypothetical protein